LLAEELFVGRGAEVSQPAVPAAGVGKVARIDPLVLGIDLAGTIVDSGAADLPEGAPVLAHGYDLGVAHHGGYAELVRIPADWVVPLPGGLSERQASISGTAGFTAALSVIWRDTGSPPALARSSSLEPPGAWAVWPSRSWPGGDTR
jgi:NADPH:quinone reductase-like Zn-dependent oxidoreductase